MGEDVLKVGSEFDPSGLTKGLNLGAASLAQFDQMVKQVSKALPGLSTEATMKIAAEGARQAAAQVKQLDAAIKSTSAGNTAWARGMENIRTSATAATTSFRTATRATNLMRGSLVTLAAQSLHTSSALGGLAQSMLFFAGGSTAVIAVAAAVLAAVKGWELYTAGQREAAKATKENSDALEKLGEQQKGPLKLAQESFALQAAEVARLTQALADLRAEQERAAQGQVGSGVEASLAAQIRLRGDEAKAVAGVTAAVENLAKAQRALDEIRAGPLLDIAREVAVLQTSEDAVRRLELVHLEASGAVLKGTVAMHDQRVALERHKKAAEESAQATRRHVEALLEMQHAVRVANAAGGGTFPQGAGGVPGAGLPIRGGLLSGASAEEITASRAAASAKDADEAFQKWFNNSFRGFKLFIGWQNEAVRRQEELIETLTDVGTGAFALADVGRSLGFIGDEAARSIEDVGRLADALAAVALSASTGNIFGAIVAGAGLIGGLFPSGPSESERLMAENNERLADLKASLDNFLLTTEGLRGSAGQLEQLRGLAITTTAVSPIARHEARQAEQDAFRRALEAAGMSIEEWAARIRQQTGLEVLNEKGQIVASTLAQVDAALALLIEQAEAAEAAEAARRAQEAAEEAAREAAEALAEVARAAEEAARRFADAFPSLLDLQSQLLGQTGAAEAFGNALSSLAFIAPNLAQMFAGIDLEDPASREVLREKLLAMIEQMLSGQLGVEQLGITPEQFGPLLDFLGIAADSLDSFDESVREATRSILNAPKGFNLAAFEFHAQTAGGPHPWPGGGRNLGSDVLPFPPRRIGTDGAALPVQQTTIVNVGDIVIQGGRDDADTIARKVKAVLARDNLVRTGDPTRAR